MLSIANSDLEIPISNPHDTISDDVYNSSPGATFTYIY